MCRIIASQEAGPLLARRAARMHEAEETVKPILDAVHRRGDAGLLEYCRRFDKLTRDTVSVPSHELTSARDRLTAEFRAAVERASVNIRAFAELQVPQPVFTQIAPGLKVGHVVRPLETIAAYVPAGRYPLPSTLMMCTIPAQVAGVKNICACSPRAVDEIFGTAALLNIPHVFQMGGAHAVAAFAFGTDTVPKADRIVGPGNIYVAAAKKLLAGDVGIDFIAGPTEILIIANGGNPKWVAADMLAQAEHDTDASALLLTTSRSFAEAVAAEVERQLLDLPTAATARIAIDQNSAIIITSSDDESCHLSNLFAPEHLSLHDAALLDRIQHAGGIFLGAASPEAAGDYAAGPSHVLPTNGHARLRGGLSVLDFVKIIGVQELTPEGLADLAPAITTIARAEGLEAHARSVEVRISGH